MISCHYMVFNVKNWNNNQKEENMSGNRLNNAVSQTGCIRLDIASLRSNMPIYTSIHWFACLVIQWTCSIPSSPSHTVIEDYMSLSPSGLCWNPCQTARETARSLLPGQTLSKPLGATGLTYHHKVGGKLCNNTQAPSYCFKHRRIISWHADTFYRQ